MLNACLVKHILHLLSTEHQIRCIAPIRLCHINFVKMNSHKTKINPKSFRNVFFNCHHFIRFRFVSFRISIVLDCRKSVSWHCTIHGTSKINRKKSYENKNDLLLYDCQYERVTIVVCLRGTHSLHSYPCCYKWLFAKRRAFLICQNCLWRKITWISNGKDFSNVHRKS